MNNKTEVINDYLKTFFTTLFIVMMFVVLNIFYMIHNIFNTDINTKKQNIDSVFEAYLVDILIDKNNDLLKQFPKNYALDMRLGILYSYKKDYGNAEKSFKNSIEKAMGYDYTPSYQLAKLYVKIGRLQDAQSVMDKINEKPNKRLIRFKGDIYSLLGDAYYNQGYIALSVMKYEKAMSYYDVINKKYTNQAKEKYIQACKQLADKYVEVGKVDEAIMTLENAYDLDSKDIMLNYKLGILYIDNNISKAYDLLTYVQKKEPQKMNYDVYFELLNKLSENELKQGNETNAELYRKKALQYRRFVKNNLLYNNDLFIDVTKSEIKPDYAAQEYIVTLQFNLQNNSGLDIDNLTINAIFKDNGKIIQNYNQKVFDDVRIFKSGDVSYPILVSASDSYKENGQSGNIDIEVYAYKYPKYQVKLYSCSMKKPDINQ